MNESITPADGSMRLSKRMAELGLASRREADEWIARGWVFVDGIKTDVLGSKVLPHQKITVSRAAKEESDQRVTVLINKPIGYVSGQAEDGHRPASTLVVPDTHWADDPRELPPTWRPPRSLAPAGRLDIDSTGLLVLTEDGRIARHLIGEDSRIEKEYLVRVEGTLSPSDLALLHHGLSLDGAALKPARVAWQNRDQLRFVLREGKKRQIRRMCELVGLRVVGLKRVRVGGVMLGDPADRAMAVSRERRGVLTIPSVPSRRQPAAVARSATAGCSRLRKRPPGSDRRGVQSSTTACPGNSSSLKPKRVKSRMRIG